MEHTENNDVFEDLVDEAEAAKLIHQTPRTLTVWRCERRGPSYVKLGRRIFYKKSDLRNFVSLQTVAPGGRA